MYLQGKSQQTYIGEDYHPSGMIRKDNVPRTHLVFTED